MNDRLQEYYESKQILLKTLQSLSEHQLPCEECLAEITKLENIFIACYASWGVTYEHFKREILLGNHVRS